MKTWTCVLAGLTLAATLLPEAACAQNTPSEQFGTNAAREQAKKNLEAERKAASKPWMGGPWRPEYFYIDQRVDAMFEYLYGSLSREPVLMEERDASITMLGFLLAENPERTKEWAELFWSAPAGNHSYFYYALAAANTNESLHELNDVKVRDASKQPTIDYIGTAPTPDLLMEPISSQLRIDALWGAFYVTGDEAYVRKIIDALEWAGPGETDDFLATIGGSAYWTLSRQAFAHSRVLRVCREEAEKREGVIQASLRAVLDDTERALQKARCPEPLPQTAAPESNKSE